MSLRLETLTGGQAVPHMAALASLRMRVFRDWPYLYDGDAAYEAGYLRAYAESAGALVVALWDGAALVGAATAAPMEDHAEAFAAPLAARGLAPSTLLYCGESVLLPGYRGRGFGHRFFDLREAHARRLGRPGVAFAAIRRPADHPARPARPRDLEPFWRRRGYVPLPGAVARFAWRDLGDAGETEKPLQLWLRHLDGRR